MHAGRRDLLLAALLRKKAADCKKRTAAFC
jgi:hypothetical protein